MVPACFFTSVMQLDVKALIVCMCWGPRPQYGTGICIHACLLACLRWLSYITNTCASQGFTSVRYPNLTLRRCRKEVISARVQRDCTAPGDRSETSAPIEVSKLAVQPLIAILGGSAAHASSRQTVQRLISQWLTSHVAHNITAGP